MMGVASCLVALFVGEPLPHRGHAHNDYLHARPLLDALEHGFASVEADVFPVGEELLVAHTPFELRRGRTLEALYLEPLKAAVARHGMVRPGMPHFHLLIDVKVEPAAAWRLLEPLLDRHAAMLSETADGRRIRRAVTVVVSGAVPEDAIRACKRRRCGIDGRPRQLGGGDPPDLVPWISEPWPFRWNGKGPVPDDVRRGLAERVGRIHAEKRLARFWGAPDTASTWAVQRDAGVDLVGADRLAEAAATLRSSTSAK